MGKIINNKGITLIALVVTIIILLILAGITLATLTGNNGLIEKTNEAKISTEMAAQRDELEIDIYNSHDKRGNLDIDKLKEKLGDRAGDETEFPLTVTYENGTFAIVLDDGKYIDNFDFESGLGDVNFDGKVDELDINDMIRYDLGLRDNLSEEAKKTRIDANKDGIFDGSDITAIYAMAFKKNGSSAFNNVLADVNLDGRIDNKDFVLVSKYVAEIATLSSDQLLRADINEDGECDSTDALRIKYIYTFYSKHYINKDNMGDVNYNLKVDYEDINAMIDFLLSRGSMLPVSRQRIDYNNDGRFDGSDITNFYEEAFEEYGKNSFTNVKGDVNLDGKIDNKDYQLISKYKAEIITLSSDQLLRADINEDGEVDISDVTMIQIIIDGDEGINL